MTTRPIYLTYTPAATDTDALGNNVTGASFTLTATSAGDNLAHIITILNNTATDHSGKTITIVGTDSGGNPQTETITGPGNAATVSTTKYFLTVSSVTPSATIGADTFDIGYTAVAVSQTIPINHRAYSFPLTNQVVVTGTVSYTIQQTCDSPYKDITNNSYDYNNLTWFPDANLTAQAANKIAAVTYPIQAERLLINSVTTGATVKLTILHSNEGK